MDIKTMAKQECYAALMRLVDKQDLNGIRKLAQAIDIKEKDAKAVLNNELDNLTQADLIKFTASLISLRVSNGNQEN